MPSAHVLFTQFRDSLVGIDDVADNNNIPCSRVRFLLHQHCMAPANLDELFFNLLSSLPTSPIYAFMSPGVLGTNISRTPLIGVSVVISFKGKDRALSSNSLVPAGSGRVLQWI